MAFFEPNAGREPGKGRVMNFKIDWWTRVEEIGTILTDAEGRVVGASFEHKDIAEAAREWAIKDEVLHKDAQLYISGTALLIVWPN